MFKLGVVGSRRFNDYVLLRESLEPVIALHHVDTIVSGGAIGADRLAERFADEYGLKKKIYYPDLESYYPFARAAKERNILIVKDSNMVVAFWDGKSSGTKHTINVCNALKKECLIIPT